MSINDISQLLITDTVEGTIVNIVSFICIINFIGLVFILLSKMIGVNRR